MARGFPSQSVINSGNVSSSWFHDLTSRVSQVDLFWLRTFAFHWAGLNHGKLIMRLCLRSQILYTECNCEFPTQWPWQNVYCGLRKQLNFATHCPSLWNLTMVHSWRLDTWCVTNVLGDYLAPISYCNPVLTQICDTIWPHWTTTLQWRHNGHDCVSNHQPHDCLLNRLFRRRLKKTSKLRITGPCAGNSPLTGEFPAQRVSNAEKVSIWWRRHDGLNFKPVTSMINSYCCLSFASSIMISKPQQTERATL